ncbi:envelope biogenesis factor ElyC [Vibrio sp.]|uniref:Envelope biogenesis factor ElyC n=1 Tax=Vibrio viridaestus TaxID=2487322 RepID=A0A3N9TD25_9VIBR|nr:envelope biogenesis factor ElyC [Vibrio viridaestus]MDC0609472.1 envelope biogenesis factor ElyC [Vibrio sp.]RQW61950.1 envelope biogenesis factor ElyC [Vibrio viridaestus]
MFELKKILSALVMPMPALLIIGFLGLMLVMFTSKRKTGCLIVLISYVTLFLASFQPVSSRLLMPLERQYHAFLPVEGNINYILVLGSGHVVDDSIPPTSEISRTALMRLTEGIRINRMYPGSKLILSGYDGGTSVSHARMLAKVALSLGVAKSDIVLMESARDTWEEAHQTASYIGNSRLVLVTSAAHMPRAMTEFEEAGLSPIPAPTNYLAQKDIEQPWTKYTPNAQYLEQTEIFWHERLGKVWRILKNWAATQEETVTQKEMTTLQ